MQNQDGYNLRAIHEFQNQRGEEWFMSHTLQLLDRILETNSKFASLNGACDKSKKASKLG